MAMTAPQISPKGYESVFVPTPSARGLLRDSPVKQLVQWAMRKSFSGTLSLQKDDKKKKIWFSNGEVFRLQSNLASELFGQRLVHRGWITEENLRHLLVLQLEMTKRENTTKRLGKWAQETFGLRDEEIDELVLDQAISSFVQGLAWSDGEYEFQELELAEKQVPLFSIREVLESLENLFEAEEASVENFYQKLKPWSPEAKSQDLSEVPLWKMLAGLRKSDAHGILTIRKNTKLFEIVLKHGIPMIYYEGTFGQPRQVIVVRQVSERHETFFVELVVRLFSFVSGTAYFRPLGAAAPLEDWHENSTSERTRLVSSSSPKPKTFFRTVYDKALRYLRLK